MSVWTSEFSVTYETDACTKLAIFWLAETLNHRFFFTFVVFLLPYFSVRSSRTSALCYGRSSWFEMSLVQPGVECLIYLGDGGRFGRIFSLLYIPTAITPQRPSPGTFETRMAAVTESARSRRSLRKIGDCEQSTSTRISSFNIWTVASA